MENQEEFNPKPKKDPKRTWFQPGNRAAAKREGSNQQKAKMLRTAIFNVVTYEEMEKVVRKMLWKAKRGNIQAATLIMDRCLGKAAQNLEITASDAEQEISQMTTEDLMRLAAGNN